MWTEKMDEILTSRAARRIVPQLSPIYGSAYVALWLFNAVGTEIDAMEQRSDELALQVLPQTATWSMPYWEQDYGVKTNESIPLEERRRALLSTMRMRAPMNPTWIENVLSVLSGTAVHIKENVSKNRFEVIADDELDIFTKQKLQDKLKEIKPAHLIYLLTQTVNLSVQESNKIVSAFMFLLRIHTTERFIIPQILLSFQFSQLPQSAMDVIIHGAFFNPQQANWRTLITFSFLHPGSFAQDASELSFAFNNNDSTTGKLAYQRPWTFNGDFCFDGSHQFNSGDSEEVI